MKGRGVALERVELGLEENISLLEILLTFSYIENDIYRISFFVHS
jgi:hypothetical protein